MKDLNVRPGTIKVLEKNIGGKLLDIGLGDNFLESDIISKSNKSKQTNKQKQKTKWDYLKLKSSAQQKRPSTNPTEWEKIFANHFFLIRG